MNSKRAKKEFVSQELDTIEKNNMLKQMCSVHLSFLTDLIKGGYLLYVGSSDHQYCTSYVTHTFL